MISRLHQKLGTAGFILSMVALVAAMSGGAYAAISGAEKRMIKKESKKFSKKFSKQFAKRGPAGPQGLPGAPGAQGLPGQNGSDGANGSKGADGSNGKSVVVANEGAGPNCEDGGVAVRREGEATTENKYVCNGQEGSPWTAGGTLPGGETLSGVFGNFGAGFTYVPISYGIPLEAPATVVLVKTEGENAASCPGNVENPDAAAGKLCIYFAVPNFEELNGAESFKSGAALALLGGEINVFGTWAVTAPTA